MTPEDAERWIVNLIRNARLDAKIDSEKVFIAFNIIANKQGKHSYIKITKHVYLMMTAI